VSATDFASAIRHARLAVGISQRRLAALAGVTHCYISHIEAGRRKPSLETLERIAKVLGMRLALVPTEGPPRRAEGEKP
jgi:transcriptional regulator with XRE-family HTH domain